MMLYKLMLCLFTFGAIVGAVNEAGFFAYKLPETSGATMNEVQITEYVNSTTTSSVGSFSVFSAIWSFMKIIGTGLTAMLAIGYILFMYGVPLYMCAMIQTPIWIIEMFGVYQLVTGNIGVEK